ncbi:MAG: hypothetical protein HOI95_17190 [Chromatiales bacterium]|jgi:hypothetical protein|nr:hypothetical protein [Chromatiales bacterium]
MPAANALGPSDLPIRPDYGQSLVDTIAAIANPGTWWSGATRVAIAEVSRFAIVQAPPLAPWDLPSAQPGLIETMTRLPISAVAADAAYRELMAFQAAGYVPRGALVSVAGDASRPLSRDRVELVAAATSAANECFY